jgi:hypothetical protein
MMEKRAIRAIDDAFQPDGIDSFLACLNIRGARISSIQEASSDLTEWIAGGAFRRGDKFITSFWEVFETLEADQRDRVTAHYKSNVELLGKKFANKYPKIR